MRAIFAVSSVVPATCDSADRWFIGLVEPVGAKYGYLRKHRSMGCPVFPHGSLLALSGLYYLSVVQTVSVRSAIDLVLIPAVAVWSTFLCSFRSSRLLTNFRVSLVSFSPKALRALMKLSNLSEDPLRNSITCFSTSMVSPIDGSVVTTGMALF